MKYKDFEGEKALDVLADLIEPAAEIMSDKNVAEQARAGKRMAAIRAAIKDHKKSVITMLAVLNDEDPATYKPKLLTLPMMLLEILNDPDIADLFTSQGQEMEENASGSAMGNTGGVGK